MKDTPDAPATARAELDKLGPLSLDEKITAGAFAVTVGLWIFGGSVGINAVAAALLGLSILLITNVVKWKDCLGKALNCSAQHSYMACLLDVSVFGSGLCTFYREHCRMVLYCSCCWVIYVMPNS